MADGKKAFILKTELINLVVGSNIHGVEIEPMTDEEAGRLFKWILMYVNDMHPAVPKEIKFAVAQVKQQLDYELERYKDICKKNKENIIKRWQTNKQESIRPNTTEYDSIPTDTKNTNINININKNINNKDTLVSKDTLSSKLNDACKEIINYLNLKTGKHYKSNSKATLDFIKARLNDKYTVDDFKHVIDVKTSQWLGTEQEKYLRPETLFRPSHFESYLNEQVNNARGGNYDISDGYEEL